MCNISFPQFLNFFAFIECCTCLNTCPPFFLCLKRKKCLESHHKQLTAPLHKFSGRFVPMGERVGGDIGRSPLPNAITTTTSCSLIHTLKVPP
ncbi:hypothetical protein HanPI659440_Chr03g0103551 [Helianthus annuus]|nr:hypothetical protein HanPI659440_Chr03g0103551 [Helianthus annuus]